MVHLNIVHLETWLNEVQSSNPGAIRQAFGFVFLRVSQLEVMPLNAIHIWLCRKNYTSLESITRSPKQRHLTQSDEELLWFSLAWMRLLCFRASQQVATWCSHVCFHIDLFSPVLAGQSLGGQSPQNSWNPWTRHLWPHATLSIGSWVCALQIFYVPWYGKAWEATKVTLLLCHWVAE